VVAIAWSWLGLALALLGPGLIAVLWTWSTREAVSLRASAPWLGVFVLLVAGVVTIARRGEELSWAEVGFGRISWASLPFAIALTLFFVFVFGPLASRTLLWLRLGSFEAGRRSLAALPRWYLCLSIVIVGAGEEWLYRGYAIERLQALTGEAWLAGVISLLAFGFVHLPVWGIGVSLSALVAGGILAALYLWRRDISFLILAHVATDLYGLAAFDRHTRRSP
jgi:membrane protease YdiL (CAAX protease family)